MKTFKVLVWHQKHGDCYVAARDEEEELKAYLYIFKMMDDDGYYSYDDALDKNEVAGYKEARAGNGRAARWLLDRRCGIEYERVDVEWVTVP